MNNNVLPGPYDKNFDSAFGQLDTMFYIMFGIAIVVFILVFVFVLLMIFSPKFKAKFMSKQIKATKYVLDDNKKDLKNIVDTGTDISKDALKTTISVIKEGLSEEKNIYCKYCGEEIDDDSKYCKNCGRKQ